MTDLPRIPGPACFGGANPPGCAGQFDVLAQAGAGPSIQSDALGELGKEKIREFVRDGGVTSASAPEPIWLPRIARTISASSMPVWSTGALGLAAAAMCKSASPRKAGATFKSKIPVAQIRYNQGPLLARDSQVDLPTYTELAIFETEIAKKEAPSA